MRSQGPVSRHIGSAVKIFRIGRTCLIEYCRHYLTRSCPGPCYDIVRRLRYRLHRNRRRPRRAVPGAEFGNGSVIGIDRHKIAVAKIRAVETLDIEEGRSGKACHKLNISPRTACIVPDLTIYELRGAVIVSREHYFLLPCDGRVERHGTEGLVRGRGGNICSGRGRAPILSVKNSVPNGVRSGSAIARLMPSLCHTPVWLLKKTSSKAPNWLQSMEQQKEQTTYFGDDRVS